MLFKEITQKGHYFIPKKNHLKERISNTETLSRKLFGKKVNKINMFLASSSDSDMDMSNLDHTK